MWPDYDSCFNSGTANYGTVSTATNSNNSAASTVYQQCEHWKIASPVGQYLKGQPLSITIRPRAQTSVGSDPTSALGSSSRLAGMAPAGSWMDCGWPGIPHYGMNYMVDNNTTALTINFVYTYWVKFKNVR